MMRHRCDSVVSEFPISCEADAIRRIERLYAISEHIREARPHTVSASRLAAQLGVTRRTIERDLAALRSAGLPIYGVPGRNGGTASVARGGSSVVTLTEPEVVALVVAAHLAADAPFATSASTAIVKLLDSLDAPQRVTVDELRGRFRLAATPGRSGRPRVRSVLEDALRTRTVVRLTYVDRNGARTVRDVEPTGFYLADDTWALIAWCQLRRDGRQFALDRIRAVHPTRRVFEPRDPDVVLGWVPTRGTAP